MLNTGVISCTIDHGTGEVNFSSVGTVNDGSWRFVACVFNRSSNGEVYLDGFLDNTGDISGQSSSISNGL